MLPSKIEPTIQKKAVVGRTKNKSGRKPYVRMSENRTSYSGRRGSRPNPDVTARQRDAQLQRIRVRNFPEFSRKNTVFRGFRGRFGKLKLKWTANTRKT